jgi:hypothetical protein
MFVTGGLTFLTGSGISAILSGNNIILGLAPSSLTTLTGAGNVTITSSGSYVIVSGGGGGAGEVNTASNLGTGSGLFAQKSTYDLQFKSLIAGTGLIISGDANSLTFHAGTAVGATPPFNKTAIWTNSDGIPSGTNYTASVWRTNVAATLTGIHVYRVGGSGVFVNAFKNGTGAMLPTNLSITGTSVWNSSGVVSSGIYVVGDFLTLTIMSLSGLPTSVSIQADFTAN